jgi:hypothetical protein
MKRAALGMAAALVAAGGIAAAVIGTRGSAPRAQAKPPELALLTSLPLVFAEQFTIDGGGSAALRRLEERYRVVPIGVADASSLKGQRLLLMAHPRAQPPEALVDLDDWVRSGGRLLLLADPKLDWHSERPLGDPLRPPPGFADTGLLARWGLALRGPEPNGPATVGNGEVTILAVSPGRLAGDSCRVAGDGFVARCRIGRGWATIVADADFLNVEGEGAIDGPTERNLDLLMIELARLETP